MLNVGKLDSELLKEIVFNNIRFKRPEVLVRPGIGEDCAAVDFGEYDCILSTDPITAAVSDIGRLSVHISCNDIASNGVEPLGIMLAVMLPVGTTEEEVREMMRQAGEAAEALGVEIIGGHTEITPAVVKPVIVSTALGRAVKSASQSAGNMRPGDFILITKSAGIEGTGIIACDFEKELLEPSQSGDAPLTKEELEKAKAFLDQVSVVKEGVAAGKIGTAGMHDITEGGILGAVWEMCQIAGLGAELWQEAIPMEPVTVKICNRYEINPLRLISSGCMLIMAPPEKKEALINAIEQQGVQVTCIGQVKEQDFGIRLLTQGDYSEIEPPGSDELYKVVK